MLKPLKKRAGIICKKRIRKFENMLFHRGGIFSNPFFTRTCPTAQKRDALSARTNQVMTEV